MPAHEIKFTPLDLKQVEPDGTFAGYASLFNTEDMGRDIVLPGAFRDSLGQRGPAGIKLLFQHKPDEPIGIWESLKEDARGLYARGRLMLDVARAREILALMRAGALDGLSIGFRAVVGQRDAKTGSAASPRSTCGRSQSSPSPSSPTPASPKSSPARSIVS